MLRLEPFENSDYNRLIAWVDSAEMLLQFAGPAFSFPLTAGQLEESCGNPARRCYKVMLASTGQVIGHCEIYLREHTGWLGRILIGDASQRGKGLGKQIVNILLTICFEKLTCDEVKLNVYDRNKNAIRCYESCGFALNPDGRFERVFEDQVWYGHQMRLSKNDWRNLHSLK